MNAQLVALTKPNRFGPVSPIAHHAGRRGLASFLGHAAAMSVAMMIGMAVFGGVLDPDVSPDLYALFMAVSMTVPMVAWMRSRRHSWRLSAEMAAAMVVPVVALILLVWWGLISPRMLNGLQHGLMLPSMLAAMLYRRTEYGL